MVSDRIVDFQYFFKFHRSGNMVRVSLEELWMVSDRIVDFQYCFKFHRSGPAKIFSFSTLTEHIRYSSKKLLIKQKTS